MATAYFRVPGPVGATRYRGREVREQLELVLAASSPGDRIEIDLRQVEAMTVSFADELIGRVLSSRSAEGWIDRMICLVGASEDIRETVEAVAERRKVIVLYRDAASETFQALAAPSWFAATVELAKELQTFRATDLATRLKVTAQAANGRLQQLLSAGAVSRQRAARERGGKEFEYTVL